MFLIILLTVVLQFALLDWISWCFNLSAGRMFAVLTDVCGFLGTLALSVMFCVD